MQTRNKSEVGLTVIELVVSLSIIAIIFSISMVGLSSARESARNMACMSNERQIGIAITSYEVAFRALPNNVLEELREWGPIPSESHSANARLLPFLDDASKMNVVSFGKNDVGNDMKLDTPAVFRCPSESKATSRSFNYCYSIGTRSRPSSFIKAHESERDGAFGTSDNQNLTGLGGKANLIYVSERSVGSNSARNRGYGDGQTVDFEQGNGKRDWYSIFFYGEPQSGFFTPNQWTQICSRTLERRPIWVIATGGSWTSGAEAHFNQIMTPNSQIPDCGMLGYQMHGCRSARSEHRHHVNVLFGDGSVQVIDDAIELDVWRDLGAVEKRITPSVDQ